MTRILFVCSSNRSRSPMAAAYFAHYAKTLGMKDLEIETAGLRAQPRASIAPEAVEALAALGVEPLRKGVKLLLPKMVKMADLIICMTSNQQDEVNKNFMGAIHKTKTLMSLTDASKEVFDPNKLGVEKYQQCLAMMKPALEELAQRLS